MARVYATHPATMFLSLLREHDGQGATASA
jgi:hypothetical protein